MLRLFSRRSSPPNPSPVPQFTAAERALYAYPASTPPALGYEAYDQMQGDTMVQAALRIKKLGVLSAPWWLDGDPERVAFVREALAAVPGLVEGALWAAMDAFAKGWSIQELVWEQRDDRWVIAALRPKDPARFGIEFDAYGRISGLQLHQPGEPSQSLPRDKFVLYIHQPTYARPKGQSDLDPAFRHWQAKTTLLTAWRTHLEQFASPTVLGKYQRGLPSAEQSAILAALRDLSQSSAIVFPEEIDISTLGGGREPSGNFQTAIDYHNAEIARAILGQTLTTDEGRRLGSFALGKVHLQVLRMQLAALRTTLAQQVLNEQIVRPLVQMNFGHGPVPTVTFEETPLDFPELG